MTSNSESEFIPDELLSGYLDNELSADERACVESTLESSERHRQILAELRALRDGLGSLPRHDVDANFQQRVLDRIANAPTSGSANRFADEEDVSLSSRSAVADHSALRRNVMALAAIAASLLIAFVWFRDLGDRKVVDNSPRESNSAKVELADSATVEPLDDVSNEGSTNDGNRSNDALSYPQPAPNNSFQYQVTAADDTQREVEPAAMPSEVFSMNLPTDQQARSIRDDNDSDVDNDIDNEPASRGALGDSVADVDSRLPGPITFAAKQLAQIVYAVQKDQVDVVLEIRTTDVEAVIAMLPTLREDDIGEADGTDRQSREFSRTAETEGLDERGTRQIVATMNAEVLQAVTQNLRASGTTVNLLDSPTVLATVAQPEVRYRYDSYYSAPDVSVADSYLTDSEPKQYDLYIDLDAESPRGEEEAKIAVLPMQLHEEGVDAVPAAKSSFARRKMDIDKTNDRNPELRILIVIVLE